MSIVRKFTVTIEKEIEVELPDNFAEEGYLKDFREGLWHVDSVEEVAAYAARMAAVYGAGISHDGIGLLDYDWATYPRVPDVKFRELYEEITEEPA